MSGRKKAARSDIKPGRLRRSVMIVMRLCIGCLFLWSSVSKIVRPYDFLSNVYEYELVTPKVGVAVAVMLPWLELAIGMCLVGGIFLVGAFLAGSFLGAVFVFVQASVLHRGLSINCGCFGSSDSSFVSYGTLARTCLIFLACLWSYLSLLSAIACRRQQTLTGQTDCTASADENTRAQDSVEAPLSSQS